MKYLLAAVAVLFFQATSVVAAGTCRVIEYAELKDTSSKDLVRTYCRYKQFVALEQEQLERIRDLYLKASNSAILEAQKKDLAEHGASFDGCLDTQMKIRSALRNRGEPNEPMCE